MRKHGPWIIKRRTRKYKNRWIEVYEDAVIRPDGKSGIYGVVRQVPGVSILPMDKKGNVYLTKEFKYAIGRKSIEVVSGAIDKGETPLRAAKRELEEELGIEAKEWIPLGTMNPFTSVIRSPAYLFLARTLKLGGLNQEGTEKVKKLKMKLTRAIGMVMEGKITHGQSCVLILKAYEYLRKRRK